MSLFDKEELRRLLADTKAELLDEGIDERTAERLTRKEYVKWLGDYSSSLKETIHANVTLPAEEREERIKRQREDLHYFRTTYFPHYYYLPGKSELQAGLEEIYHRIAGDHIQDLSQAAAHALGEKFAVGAPRGHGKTTDAHLVFFIWCIVNDLKHFLTLFSDAVELAETIVESIKAEMEENDNLKADFPHATGRGKVWKIGKIVTRNNICVQAFGSGKRVRGIKHGVHRPDHAGIDDLENDENVRSRDQRDKLEAWLDEAVGNLGSADGSMSILYTGTLLHNDAVLARKLKLKFWNPRIYRAIITFPKRMDLWERYAQLYKHVGLDEAHAFYEANRPEMDEGAKVLWPEAVPLETLMRKRAEAPRSFAKELQNNPNSESQRFKREKMHFYKSPPANLECYGWCDPAGNGKKSDFTSTTILGVDRQMRKAYILVSDNRVLGSRQIIDNAIDLQRLFKCKKFGFETNGGQFHLKNWLLEAAFDAGVHMPVKGFHNSKNKDERIESLELPIENGQILLHEDQIILIQQLEDHPDGDHDDAPDSLEGCYMLSRLAKQKKSGSGKARTNRRTVRNRSERGRRP
jgi:predicted phage terminase large subunit-like protein